jgi:hypothetical protein
LRSRAIFLQVQIRIFRFPGKEAFSGNEVFFHFNPDRRKRREERKNSFPTNLYFLLVEKRKQQLRSCGAEFDSDCLSNSCQTQPAQKISKTVFKRFRLMHTSSSDTFETGGSML